MTLFPANLPLAKCAEIWRAVCAKAPQGTTAEQIAEVAVRIARGRG